MSKGLIGVLVAALLAATATAIGVDACSSANSPSGSNDPAVRCNQSCEKSSMCAVEGGALGESIVASCKQRCTTDPSHPCRNQATISAKLQECFAVADCAGFMQCLQSIPVCEGGSTSTSGTTTETTTGATTHGAAGGGAGGGSTGGTAGAGGSSQAGGSAGSGGSSGASCDACVKADACCVASGGTTEMCKYAETCTAQPDSERAMTVATCTSVVQAFASNPNAPAACK